MLHITCIFRLRSASLMGILALVVAGCVPGQPVALAPAASLPTPVVSEPVISVPQPTNPGEQIGISVRVDSVPGMAITYEWAVPEGKGEILDGQGTNAITYQSPIEPGTYSIRAKVTTANASIERSTFITVRKVETSTSSPPIIPTGSPAPTRVPMPTKVSPSGPPVCEDNARFLEQAKATKAGGYYLSVPEWADVAAHAQVHVCVYEITSGSPVKQGVWTNSNLVFPAHSITRVHGNVIVMSVIWESQETLTARAPIEFLGPDRMNDRVRGLIADDPSQFDRVVIYEHDQSSIMAGASAEFVLSTTE